MAKIKLTKNKIAIVSACDFKELSKHKWQYSETAKGSGYACRMIRKNEKNKIKKNKKLYMHMAILGERRGMEIDHVNGNKLDNRRKNLRFCTRSQNMLNSRNQKIGMKGVTFSRNRWLVRIRHDGKSLHLGYFKDKVEAMMTYDLYAKKYHGAFAALNFQGKK